jgi:hypothetical protein
MKEYFGDSTGRYYSDVMDIADIRPLLCDRCLAIFERHVSGDGAEFCRSVRRSSRPSWMRRAN